MNNKKLYENIISKISKVVKHTLNEEITEGTFTVDEQYYGPGTYDLSKLDEYDEKILFQIVADLDKIIEDFDVCNLDNYEFDEPFEAEYPFTHKSGRDFIDYKTVYIDSVFFDSRYNDLRVYEDGEELGPYDKIEDEEVRKELLKKTIKTIANLEITQYWNELTNSQAGSCYIY